MPLLTVFLRVEAEFSFLAIGIAMSLMNVPMICSPALITLLADKNVDPRRILAVAFTLSSCVLTSIYFSESLTLTFILFFFHGLSFVAMLPLQDGFYFTYAEENRKRGISVPEYPMIRIWGTIGFILPSVILFFVLRKTGGGAGAIIPCAVVFCLLSLANSFTLPKLSRALRSTASKQFPTQKALATLFSKEARWLCVGLALAFFCTSSYYGFIANYYTEIIGIPNKYIGLIMNIGVVLEIFYTLLMPRLQRWLTLKGILVCGLGFMSLRMFLLWAFPSMATVLITQIGHGLEVMALFVVPVMFLNRLAGDEFRNSIQGVYTMAVGGVARVIAGVSAGLIVTQFGLQTLFLITGSVGCVATLVIAVLFARIPPPVAESEASPNSHP